MVFRVKVFLTLRCFGVLSFPFLGSRDVLGNLGLGFYQSRVLRFGAFMALNNIGSREFKGFWCSAFRVLRV